MKSSASESVKVPMEWKIEVLKNRRIWKAFKSEDGVFLFVISHLVPEIFNILVLCKFGTDDVIRCDSMEVKTQENIIENWNLVSML